MSTDRKRLTSAIQRIAREDPEIRALLDDYRNSGGKPSSSSTTGSGAEDRQTCCDGSSTENANPGSDTKDPSAGGQDANDGLNDDNPADLGDMGPGSLVGVKDCTTGEPICFTGSDWVPPDGWDEPTTPPIDSDFVPGQYALAVLPSGTSIYQTATGARSVVCSAYCECAAFESQCTSCWEPNLGFNGSCAGGSEQYSYSVKSCDEEYDPICDEPPPLANSWPEDGCVNLAIKGGKLVGSKFDPENDGSYSKPRNSIELCDDFGNSFELAPSASGVWKTISSQNPDDGYLYDATGTQIARISGSEYADPNV